MGTEENILQELDQIETARLIAELNRLLTVKEAAAFMGVSRETVLYFIHLKSLPRVMVDGVPMLRYGTLIRWKNGWEIIPLETIGEAW